jgi:hypothetical protein
MDKVQKPRDSARYYNFIDFNNKLSSVAILRLTSCVPDVNSKMAIYVIQVHFALYETTDSNLTNGPVFVRATWLTNVCPGSLEFSTDVINNEEMTVRYCCSIHMFRISSKLQQ